MLQRWREAGNEWLRRQLLRLLSGGRSMLGIFPCHSAHDQRADRDGTRLIVSGGPLVDDGEEFHWHADSGCGGKGHSFRHDDVTSVLAVLAECPGAHSISVGWGCSAVRAGVGL